MILDRFNLKGKTALVTGSSRGLGAGIAMALAEAGADVAVHGSRAVPEATLTMLSGAGANTFALIGDVSKASVCERLVEQVVHHFGAIDILVNNAGIIRRAPAVEHSDEDWQAVIDTNLFSVFRLTQACREAYVGAGVGQDYQYRFSADLSRRSVCSFVCGGQGRRRATDEGIRQ